MFGKKPKKTKDLTEKPCRICGQTNWRRVVIKEPVDRSFLLSRAEQDIEFRVCTCGYAERVD
jgi:hypothetical protein